MLSISIAFFCALLCHQALSLQARLRPYAVVALSTIALASPFLQVPAVPVFRFLLGVFSSLMVFKMWELARQRQSGRVLAWRDHLRFVSNLFCLSLNDATRPRRRSRGKGLSGLLRVGGGMLASVMMLTALQRFPGGAIPFWLAHLVVSLALLVFVVCELELYVLVTRAFGAPIGDANEHPWRALTPADFWRRYNLIIGHFLHANVYRPMQCAGHPVWGLLAVFAVSALLHEYVFWLALGKGAGLQTLFFLIQGAAVALTARIRPRGAAVILWRIGTWVFLFLTSILFFASFHLMFPVYPGPSLADWVNW